MLAISIGKLHKEVNESATHTIFQLDGPHAIYATSVDGHIRSHDICQGRVTACIMGAPIVRTVMADDCVVVWCSNRTMRLVDKELGKVHNGYH